MPVRLIIILLYFQDFLKKEFSEENVEFWKVCQNYRNIIDSNFVSILIRNKDIVFPIIHTHTKGKCVNVGWWGGGGGHNDFNVDPFSSHVFP